MAVKLDFSLATAQQLEMLGTLKESSSRHFHDSDTYLKGPLTGLSPSQALH